MKLALFLVTLPLFGQTAFRASQATALAGAFADVKSSYGLQERNPILGAGEFGHRQATFSMAITAGLVLAESPLIRKFPQMRKPFTVLNFVMGGIRFSVAAHNSRLTALN